MPPESVLIPVPATLVGPIAPAFRNPPSVFAPLAPMVGLRGGLLVEAPAVPGNGAGRIGVADTVVFWTGDGLTGGPDVDTETGFPYCCDSVGRPGVCSSGLFTVGFCFPGVCSEVIGSAVARPGVCMTLVLRTGPIGAVCAPCDCVPGGIGSDSYRSELLGCMPRLVGSGSFRLPLTVPSSASLDVVGAENAALAAVFATSATLVSRVAATISSILS